MTKQRDIIVIGAGLSGASATLQAAQVGFKVISLTKPNDPGYWARVKRIPQFPGIPEEISGKDLIGQIKKQAEQFSAVFHEFEVTEIKSTEQRTYEVCSHNGESYEAPVVIIASGVSKDEHFLAGEQDFVGKGSYYSVFNDAPTLKHQSAAIIGKSQEAAEAALYLSKFSEKITFIIPSSKLDITEKVFHELEANRKIEMLFSSSIKKMSGDDELHALNILSAGSEREIKTRSAFIYTYNLKPCTEFAKSLIDVDEKTERIPVNSDFSTSKPGVYACGDVLSGELQNPAISVAQGIITGLNAEKYLNG